MGNVSQINLILDALKIHDESENQNCRKQIGQIWSMAAEKSFTQSTGFVRPGKEKMEESNNRSFEFSTFQGKKKKETTRKVQSVLSTEMRSMRNDTTRAQKYAGQAS